MANKHLMELYSLSNEIERSQGMSWYEDARNFCCSVAATHAIPLEPVVAVVSLLSPRNKWDRNKLDAETLIAAEKKGDPLESVTVATFNGNRQRAWDLLKLGKFNPDKIFKGQKTRAFYDNLIDPDSDRVTVDTWAARAAYNTKANWMRSIGIREYRRLEAQYKTVAKAVKIKPYQLQAVVWVCIRNRLLGLTSHASVEKVLAQEEETQYTERQLCLS